ncbi:putative transcriptional regulator [Pyrococcus sp. ST04]|nr:putative transcriptional regulator [Pyrococcus sp. ST04]
MVEILRERGLKQGEIAELLHITQSAVSRYLKMSRGALIDVRQFSDIEDKLRETAKWIMEEKPSEYEIHKALIKITVEMLAKGYVCSFHSKIDPTLNPNECNVCLEVFQ